MNIYLMNNCLNQVLSDMDLCNKANKSYIEAYRFRAEQKRRDVSIVILINCND